MTTRKTVVKEIKEEDTQAVVAYRVGVLETTLSTGLKEINTKLDGLRDGVVSHEQLAEVEKAANKVHQDHESRLRTIEKFVDESKGRAISRKELLAWVAAAMGAAWWLPELIKQVSGR